NQGCALEQLAQQGAFIGAGFGLAAEREGHRYATDEQEEGEDPVGESPAVPLRVFQLGVQMTPVARIIHQQHAGDGESTEGVEGRQPILGYSRRLVWHQYFTRRLR